MLSQKARDLLLVALELNFAESALAKAAHKVCSVTGTAPVFLLGNPVPKARTSFFGGGAHLHTKCQTLTCWQRQARKTGPAAFVKHETRLAASPSGRRRGPGSGAAASEDTAPFPPSPPPWPFPLQPAPSRHASASSSHSRCVASAFVSKVFSKRCRALGW